MVLLLRCMEVQLLNALNASANESITLCCIPPTRCCHNVAIRSSPYQYQYHTIFTRLTLLGLLLFNTNNNNNQSNMKLSILLIGSASIAIVSAQDTPAPFNPSPTEPPQPVPPPITPFPTEGPPVSYI